MTGRGRVAILHRIGAEGEGGVKAGQAVIPAVAALAVWACLWRGASVTLLGFTGAVLVIALCIWLVAGTVSSAVALHNMRILTGRSWLRLLVSGHVLRLVVALVLALWAAVWITVALVADPWRTLAGAGLIAVVLVLAARLSGRVIGGHVIAEQHLRYSLPLAIVTAGAAALALSLLLPNEAPATLAEGVARAVRYTGPSALLGQVFDLYALSAGVTDLLRGTGLRALLLGILFEGSLWFGLASALALLLVPPAALAGVLRPGGRPGVVAFVVAGAVLAALVLVTLQGAATLEDRLRVAVTMAAPGDAPAPPPDAVAIVQPPGPEQAVQTGLPAVLAPTSLRAQIEREQIGGLLCPPGTAGELAALHAQMRAAMAGHEAELRAAAAAGFERMRANVPVFLDAYYSLSAEYLRTLHLLAGTAETHLQGMIAEGLGSDDASASMAAALASAREAEGALRDMTAQAEALLARCGGVLPGDDAEITITTRRPDSALRLPELSIRLGLERRLAAAGMVGAAGGIGGAVIGSLGAKLVLGPVFKSAASLLVKLGAGRLAAALTAAGGGAVAGGLGGSVVPGAGTAVGAAIGGAAGFVGAWVASDYVLLKLDESVNRAAFEAEILAAIDATEAGFIAALTGAAP